MDKLINMRRSIAVHFTLKLQDWDLYLVSKVLSIKSPKLALFILIPLSTLNGLIMVWSTIPAHITTLSSLYCLLLATGTSGLDKIHLLVHQSGPSNVTQIRP